MNRRTALRILGTGVGAAWGAGFGLRAASPSAGRDGWVDTHTHFVSVDQLASMGQGAERFMHTVEDFVVRGAKWGITQTVVIEATHDPAHNAWALALAEREPAVAGYVARLYPGREDFAQTWAEIRDHSHFMGLRLRERDRYACLHNPAGRRDLKFFAETGKLIELGGRFEAVREAPLLAELLPETPLMLCHCAKPRIVDGQPNQEWVDWLKRVADFPHVWCKLSGVVESAGRPGDSPTDLAFYRLMLEHVWSCFGPERLVFGSNWPVVDRFADYDLAASLAREFLESKGMGATRRVMRDNAVEFYQLSL